MSHSFCIITNGKKPELLRTVIKSIQAQHIAEHEIIVAGIHHAEPGITYVPAEDAAAGGRLGELRNMAVARARHENIVLMDDDIILAPDWYDAFSAYDTPFDILTSQIRLPDGGRYYDHATTGGPRGQTFLDEGEDDDYVYMTGGGGWVMKSYVARRVSWDADRAFYQEEDIDFSRRCQAQGFKISHNHAMIVYHADPTYTSIGKALKRRKEGRSHEWVVHEFNGLTTLQILKRVINLKRAGQTAEAADFVRMAIRTGKGAWLFKIIWRAYLFNVGGDLPDTSWSPEGSMEYTKLLRTLRAEHDLPERAGEPVRDTDFGASA